MSHSYPIVSRRGFIGGVGLVAGSMLPSARWSVAGGVYQTPVDIPEEVVIDLTGGPDNLDPALARSTRDWSVIHSVYDSLLLLSNEGELVPLAAESFTSVDDTTYEVVLRAGLRFHDGTPVTSAAIERGIAHVQESEGPAAANFGIVERVELLDALTARIFTNEPAAWLPSQLAVWFVLFPEDATPETLARTPVGSGPYRFEALEAGTEVVLRRNPDYTWRSPKGVPLAETARFRFVPESATRVSDLGAGGANIVTSIPNDQVRAIEDAGGEAVETAILGTAFLRLATDVAPFNDPRVGIALNHAVDVDAVSAALVSGESHRLASIFPDERSIGFDRELAPFAYDPARARALLDEAGIPPGLEVRLEFASGERDDVLQVLAAQLGEVGINVTVESLELATFNGSWQDQDSAPLRFVSWRPVFDPHTLLSLMFSSTGPLSRHRDDVTDELIRSGAIEPAPDARAEVYRKLGQRFHEAPPAIFLWNLTATYGVRDVPGSWTPRVDEYVIPTQMTEGVR